MQTKQSDGTWKTVTSAELWGILTPRLTTQEAKDKFYATIGELSQGNFGLRLVSKRSGDENILIEIGQFGNTANPIMKPNGPLIIEKSSNGATTVQDKNGKVLQNLSTEGYTGSIVINKVLIGVVNGIITDWSEL